MPISSQLDHAAAMATALTDITRRKLSIEDMYRHSVLSISHNLDLLRQTIVDGKDEDNVSIVDTLARTAETISRAVQRPTKIRVREQIPGTSADADLKLAAYGHLRDCVSIVYRSHDGMLHDRSCYVCLCMWHCAGMIGAVERYLTIRMSLAKTELKGSTVDRAQHLAVVVPVPQFETTTFEATCPECGVIGTFPQNEMRAASQRAVAHRRTMRGQARNHHPILNA